MKVATQLFLSGEMPDNYDLQLLHRFAGSAALARKNRPPEAQSPPRLAAAAIVSICAVRFTDDDDLPFVDASHPATGRRPTFLRPGPRARDIHQASAILWKRGTCWGAIPA